MVRMSVSPKPGRSRPRKAVWFSAAEISQVVNESWGSQVCTRTDVARTWEALEQQLREHELLTWGCVIGSLAAIGVLAPNYRPLREIGDDALLEQRYADRPDLGNTRPGDAARYRARGYYPIVGRLAYRRFGRRLRLGLEGKPELVAEPEIAVATLLTVLADRGLPELADRGDWEAIRRSINPSFRNWPIFMVLVRRLEAIAAHRQTERPARLKSGQVIQGATNVVAEDERAGTSIFAPEGTPVYAPVSGRSHPILERSGGFVTRIEEPNGRVHYLARGSTPFIGGAVTRGQHIGRVGSTGTGPGNFASAGGAPPHLLYSITEPAPGGRVVPRAVEPVAWGEGARPRRRLRGES
jgi:predicted chitinase